MDFKNGKVYPHFKEIQRFMEDIKDVCDAKGFKPDAVMKIDGSEIFDIIASDTFDIDIQISQLDRTKKLLIVGGVTTTRSIKKYFTVNEELKENAIGENIMLASFMHRPVLDSANPDSEVKPHMSYHQLLNDEDVVFPWEIWGSMREDMDKGLSPYTPNYFESAPDIVVNKGQKDEHTKRFTPWHQMELLCEKTRSFLKETGRKPDAVFGTARSGHIYAKVLSNYLDLPWSAELRKNMIYADDTFDSGKTAEIVGDFKNITTVAMNYRGDRTTVMPEVTMGDQEAFWTCGPHERNQNGYTSHVIRTAQDMGY